MNFFSKNLQLLTILILFSIPYASAEMGFKQDQHENAQGHGMKGGKPPQEAILSCADKSTKSDCSFQGPQGLENGTCEYTPDEQYFACNPTKTIDEN